MKSMAQIITWDGQQALTLLDKDKAERVKAMMGEGKAFIDLGDLGMLIISSIKSFKYILMPDGQPNVLNARGERVEELINRSPDWNIPELATKMLECGFNPYGGKYAYGNPTSEQYQEIRELRAKLLNKAELGRRY